MADARSHHTEWRKDACNSLSRAGKSQLQHPWAAGQIQPTDLVRPGNCWPTECFFKIQTNWQDLKFRIFFFFLKNQILSCFLENRSPGSRRPTFRHGSGGLAKAAAVLSVHTNVPSLCHHPNQASALLHSLLIPARPARLPGQSVIFI